MGFFYGYGYFSYLIYIFPVLIFSLLAQAWVKSAYTKYSTVSNSRGITGAAAAQMILNHYGITDVRIQMIGGKMTDNYNPTTKTISLSEGVYNSCSVAAVGIACHEAGHAAQHAENYLPNKIRTALVPVTNFGSRFGIIIAFIGYGLAYLSTLETVGYYMIIVGLALYGLIAVFQFVTLPVEFNASHRALKIIDESGIFVGEEYNGAKKVLSAAAMTYVAALATAVANLLYYATRLLGRNNRR